MNVLYITHYTALMGANRSMLQLMIELKDYGIVPTVLMPLSSGKTDLSKELDRNNIKYLEAPIRSIKHPNFWKVVINYFCSLLKRRKIYNLIKDKHFDIIHTNSSVIDTGSYLSRKLGAKHIWHLREFGDLDYNFKTPFGKWFQKIIYSGDNIFIAISNAISTHYSKYIDKSRICKIYNGVKIQKHKEIDVINNGIINFCIVGLIHRNKRQLDVLRAINELVNVKKIFDFHLYIIGFGDEEYTQELKSYINSHGLESYVTFMGQRNDVPDILPKMDVGIMASSNEAFGRVTVEYMLAGLTVVASDTGANGEIISHRKTGLLYPKDDIQGLADCMEMCIMEKAEIAQITTNGYNHAFNNFSSNKNSEKVYSLYAKILSDEKSKNESN